QKLNFNITAVCRDWPENSHFRFDMLINSSSFAFTKGINYVGFAATTYFLLNSHASPAKVEARFPDVIKKYVAGEIGRRFGQTYDQFVAAGNGYHYYLQKLRNIHLDSDLESELGTNGSRKAVYIFSVIAVFILLLACVNFINLSTSRSLERA